MEEDFELGFDWSEEIRVCRVAIPYVSTSIESWEDPSSSPHRITHLPYNVGELVAFDLTNEKEAQLYRYRVEKQQIVDSIWETR